MQFINIHIILFYFQYFYYEEMKYLLTLLAISKKIMGVSSFVLFDIMVEPGGAGGRLTGVLEELSRMKKKSLFSELSI